MTRLIPFREFLLRLEGRPWSAFLLRLCFSFLALFPWNYQFIPVSFRPEDLDPMLTKAWKAAGMDILDQANWPTVMGVWTRWGKIVLGAALVWWLLSLLLKVLQRRWGLKAAIFPLIAVSVLLAQGSYLLSFYANYDMNYTLSNGIPVWGGWIQGYSFTSSGFLLVFLVMLGLMVLMESLAMAARIQRSVEEAKALALQSHLAPHFLYNALNTMTGLVDEDPKAAQNAMERLGRLLRRLLESRERSRITLSSELAFVEDYLGLERAKLGNRLKVVMDIPEELLECAVPLLSVQVLVENAVKHAIAPCAEGGEVRICAAREGQDLVIQVIDSGHGPKKEQASRGVGMALDNLRSRLAKPSDLMLASTPDGFCAGFRVPCEVI